MKFQDYLGTISFGIKIGAVLPGDDVAKLVCDAVAKGVKDNLISDGDIVCVTETIVAKAQNNFISTDDMAKEIRKKLNINENSTLGLLLPMVSRNRFLPLLKGFAETVNKGKIIIQFPYPDDEVGNFIIPKEYLDERGIGLDSKISADELEGKNFRHPYTGVNYPALYKETIENEGALQEIFLSNNPLEIINHNPDAIIVCNIHERDEIKEKVKKVYENCISMQEIFNDSSTGSWSEWGLYGTNMVHNRIKLAPREGDKVAEEIKAKITKETNTNVEVIIYGDGAYKDPSQKIWELADPVTTFGSSSNLKNRKRTGVKYKLIADKLFAEGKSREFIENQIEIEKTKKHEIDSIISEGTTPRELCDLLASLADLISGSADAGTPIVIIKNF